jgi:hypothetical protein
MRPNRAPWRRSSPSPRHPRRQPLVARLQRALSRLAGLPALWSRLTRRAAPVGLDLDADPTPAQARDARYWIERDRWARRAARQDPRNPFEPPGWRPL